MSDYHLSIKEISRSQKRSATAAAAYRAAEIIKDERSNTVHDYKGKGGVSYTQIILPDGAPVKYYDRSTLWNAAEFAEKRINSQVAREFVISLPHELDEEARKKLAVDFSTEIMQRHGVAVDCCIHDPNKAGDQRNYHAHILISTRRLTAEGFGEKTREFNDPKAVEVKYWRERFADLQNEHLIANGLNCFVSHESLANRGIDREPQYHRGPSATGLERRTGDKSDITLDYEMNSDYLDAMVLKAVEEREKEWEDYCHNDWTLYDRRFHDGKLYGAELTEKCTEILYLMQIDRETTDTNNDILCRAFQAPQDYIDRYFCNLERDSGKDWRVTKAEARFHLDELIRLENESNFFYAVYYNVPIDDIIKNHSRIDVTPELLIEHERRQVEEAEFYKWFETADEDMEYLTRIGKVPEHLAFKLEVQKEYTEAVARRDAYEKEQEDERLAAAEVTRKIEEEYRQSQARENQINQLGHELDMFDPFDEPQTRSKPEPEPERRPSNSFDMDF